MGYELLIVDSHFNPFYFANIEDEFILVSALRKPSLNPTVLVKAINTLKSMCMASLL